MDAPPPQAPLPGGVGRPLVVLWSTEDWARAILDLSDDGPAPARTALVPHRRVAHGLRREMLRLGRPDGLAGTRMVTVAEAAAAVLRAAGVAFSPGEESLREARIAALFRGALRLERFDADQLRPGRGWEEAFARALRELEAEGLTPRDLRGSPRERDVAAIWAAVDRAAERSLTTPRILAEAAAVLRASPERWPLEGPVLAVAAGDLSVVERDFLLSIPRLTLGLLAARPRRPGHLARMEALLGPKATRALAAAAPPDGDGEATDLSRLGRWLFEDPGELPRRAREGAGAADGTVRIEEHASAEEEIETAAAWVASEVARGTPLEELALLVPALDPWAGLLEERLGRLPWPDGGRVPAHVAGGLPLARSAAGARALAVVRALWERLPLERLVELLPALEAAGREPLSPREALEVGLAISAGGETPVDPAGAPAWAERAEARARELAEQEEAGSAEAARLAPLLRAAGPPLAALTGVARLVTAGAPLRQLWPALRALLLGWARAPGLEAALAAAHTELGPLCQDRAAGALRGHDALEQIARKLRAGRAPAGRFGEPAVFIGTPRQARGIRFAAVRVLGLGEGVLPGPPREDPVLPGRAAAADRILAELHDLDRATRDARSALVLSTARRGLCGEAREASPVLADVAAALGRPLTPERGPALPAWPAASAAGGAAEAPADAAAEDAGWDGVISPDAPPLALPGLDADHPIDAADLAHLLACPQRFLLERVLGFAPRAPLPARARLEAEAYRGLLRRALEAFYVAHGGAFGRRERALPAWEALADQAAAEAFAAHVAAAPPAGTALREAQRERLRRDVRLLVAQDWCGGRKRRFLAVEAPFRAALPAGEAPLHVRGVIDRLDVDGGSLLVRDVQAGRCHPRGPGDPDPERDLALALYGLASAPRAEALGLRVEAVTAYAGVQVPSERAFRDDFEALAAAARGWLEALAGLLRARAFPHSPREEDCRRCPFRAACGPEAFAQAARLAAAGPPAVRAYFDLKGVRAAEARGGSDAP